MRRFVAGGMGAHSAVTSIPVGRLRRPLTTVPSEIVMMPLVKICAPTEGMNLHTLEGLFRLVGFSDGGDSDRQERALHRLPVL